MKRIVYCLFIISVFILGISIFIEPAVKFLAKKQLKKVFTGSVVSVSRCGLKPLHYLTFSGIELKKYPAYDFKIKEAEIRYNLFSLLKGEILKFHLKDADISIHLAQEHISELRRHLNLKAKGRFFLKSVELTNLNLNINAKDLNLQAKLSMELEPLNQFMQYGDFKIDSLRFRDFQLQNASLKATQMPGGGKLYISRIQYNKLKLEEIKSKIRLEGRHLWLYSLEANFLDGKLQGDFDFKIDKKREYLLNLKFLNCAIDTFVKDFNLQKKFTASGRLDGAVTLKGTGLEVHILSGDFFAVKPGGTLTIKDAEFLERIARHSGQSLDLLVESFKDYRYNTAIMKLSLDKDNLIFEIALEGDAGRRNLAIILHDFRLPREVR